VVLDGKADKAWDAAAPLKITLDQLPYEPSNGYPGMKSTEVTIKSLYDDQNVYFLISYKDPTKSLARFPWVKQADSVLEETGQQGQHRPRQYLLRRQAGDVLEHQHQGLRDRWLHDRLPSR